MPRFDQASTEETPEVTRRGVRKAIRALRDATPPPSYPGEENPPTRLDYDRIERDRRQNDEVIGHNAYNPYMTDQVNIRDTGKSRAVGFQMIPARRLRVDPRYNREISQRWVDSIAENFQPDLLGVLYVSYRGPREGEAEGEFVLIGGQHRYAAAMKRHGPEYELPCMVYNNLTLEEEAELFATMDERQRRHSPYQLFRAHLFGQNPEAVAIADLAKEVGLTIYTGTQTKNTDGVIYAVTTIKAIFRQNGVTHTRRVLETLYMAYSDQSDAYRAPMLAGMSLFIRRFGVYARFRDERMGLQLRHPSRNPLQIMQRAMGNARGGGNNSLAHEVARLFHRHYNEGLKGYDRLPDWRSTAKDIASASTNASRRERGGADGREEAEG